LSAVTVGWWSSGREDREKTRMTALDFKRVDFNSFRNPLGRILSDTILERRRVQENWLI